jgi:hypothetical protein
MMKRSTKKMTKQEPQRITNSKPIPHIPLSFKEVMKDVLKVKPPEKQKTRRVAKGLGVQPKPR